MPQAPETQRIHWRPLRAVMVLRVLVLMVLAGFVLAVVMSYGHRGAPQTRITMAPSSPTLATGELTEPNRDSPVFQWYLYKAAVI